MPPSSAASLSPADATDDREQALLRAAEQAREWIIEASARPGALPASSTLKTLNLALARYRP